MIGDNLILNEKKVNKFRFYAGILSSISLYPTLLTEDASNVTN